MSKHRIYIEGPIKTGRLMTIQGEQARYIRRVLRLRKDDALTLFDGTNGEFPAVIKAAGKDVVEVEVGPRIDRSVESPFSITLLQGKQNRSRPYRLLGRQAGRKARRKTCAALARRRRRCMRTKLSQSHTAHRIARRAREPAGSLSRKPDIKNHTEAGCSFHAEIDRWSKFGYHRTNRA